MLISFLEIIYIIITTVVVGYVFSGMFRHEHKLDPNAVFDRYKIFNWPDVKMGILVAAPGIVLHEMAHKFVALAFGLQATYQIYPTGLLIGVVLRALNSGFIFLAPGYVVISGASDLQSAITAFAGPCMNLILWLGAKYTLKYKHNLTEKTSLILFATQKINMWLFIFNMIPIPPLDGSKVFGPLLTLIGL